MTATKFVLKSSILLLLLFNLSCSRKVASGSSENSIDSSSRLPVTTTQPNSPKDVALCNKIESTYLTAHLMVYYDQTETYHPEFLRLYIPKINAEFSKSTFQLVLRKWKASPEGETFQDTTPLKVRMEKIGDHSPVTGYMGAIHWNTMVSELQKTVTTNYTLTDAFNQFSFVIDLKDPTGTFDVLKISLYNNGDWIEDWNVLIPAFYAHPKTYAENQNAVLAQLHPFYESEGSTFGGDHFASVLNSYCF